MKALYLIIPFGLAIAGCTAYPVVVQSPTPAPAVVATVPALADSDGDGVADIYDRFPSNPLMR
ncbi:MAG TPA: hypothetical protein VNN06_03235 [Ramlibacter sp.]|nr:hypothetical protein [Ramlibacter sp.]